MGIYFHVEKTLNLTMGLALTGCLALQIPVEPTARRYLFC